MIIKKLAFIFSALFLVVFSYSQTINVSGKIVSGNNQEIPGVTILLKNTSNAVLSDLKGNFEIIVKTFNDTLIFSYPGYLSQEIQLQGKTFLNVQLIDEENSIDEVVITALGIKREKKSLGYSVSEIGGDDIQKAKEISFINSMTGSVAGLSISATNGGSASSARIILRGNNSFNENQALIVVDGVPINNSTISNSTDEWGGKDFGNGISDINSEDIESISVLKGAGAAALYGSNAVNGVILIKTKSGNEKFSVKYNSSYALDIPNIQKNFQNIYGAGSNGKFETHWDINSDGIPVYDSDQASHYSSWGPKMEGQNIIDWDGKAKQFLPQPDNYKNFLRYGSTWFNSLSIEGGKKGKTLRLTASDMRNNDIIPGAKNNKTNLGLNMNLNFLEKINFSSYISYVNQRSDNRPGLSDSHTNVARNYIQMPRHISAESLEQHIFDESGSETTWYSSWNWMTNPYWNELYELSFDQKNRLFGNASLNYKLSEVFTITVRSSLDHSAVHFEEIGASFGMVHPAGFYSEKDITHSIYNNDILASYHKTWNNIFGFSFSAGGNTYYEKSLQNSQNTVNGLKEPYIYSIENSAGIPETHKPFIYEKAVNSLYYLSQLSYHNLLFIDLTGRNDWSSTLPAENNSYFYHSYNTSFVFSELYKNKKILPFGKIRFSYSIVGNDTEPYQTSLTYYTDYEDVYDTIAHLNRRIPPANLKPEKMVSFEAGTDLRFFNNRIGLDISLYKTNTYNQIVAIDISATSGASNALINAGNIENKGIEIQLRLNPIKKKDFNWSVNLNYSKNNSSVIELTEGIDNYILLEHWRLNIEARPGHPYGDIVGYGIQKDEAENNLVNENGLYIRTDSTFVLGNINPDFTASVRNNISYKNFSFSFLIDAKIGGEMFSGSNMYGNGYSGNFEESLKGREEWYASEAQREEQGISSEEWTATGGYQAEGVFAEGTVINGIDVSGQNNNVLINPFDYWHQFADWENEIHEPFIYDASFIKLREMSLSYQFNSKKLQRIKIKKIDLTLYGRNLWLIYKNVPNVDPESFHTNGNGQGYELYAYPTRRSLGINLNLYF